MSSCFWNLYYFSLKLDILLEHNVGRDWKEATTKKEKKGAYSEQQALYIQTFLYIFSTWAGACEKCKNNMQNVLAFIIEYLPKW